MDSGKSFNESLSIVSFEIRKNKTYKFLYYYLISLKISHISGSKSVHILKKVKEQILFLINFNKKMSSSTAQMRMQACVILLSPFIISFFVYLIDDKSILIFFNSPSGNFLLFIAIILYLSGAYLLKKIITDIK